MNPIYLFILKKIIQFDIDSINIYKNLDYLFLTDGNLIYWKIAYGLYVNVKKKGKEDTGDNW